MLRVATERHAALPVPERSVSPDDVIAAQDVLARAKRDLDTVDRDFQRTQGALEQVGGAVARERLRDAIEAFELAEQQEREIEAEYEAWRLLLDQMKAADDPLLDPATDAARIRAFFVHPAWARRGLARRLFERCAADAFAAGFRGLELVATLPGEPLYRALGFEPHERTAAPLPDGQTLEVVRMTRPLADAVC